jgi:hypothetical protein
MVFAVPERNYIAIGGFSENLEHFAGIHPVVSMQNSRSRFDDDAGHENSTSNAHRPTSSDPARLQRHAVKRSHRYLIFSRGSSSPPRSAPNDKAWLENTQACPIKIRARGLMNDCYHGEPDF